MTTPDSFEKCAEFFKDNHFLSKLVSPEDLKQKLQTIQEKTPYLLEEFKNIFVLYNKNPEYADYQQMFANIKSNVNNITANLFEALNEAEINTNLLNERTLCLNTLIVQERNKNRILRKQNGMVEEKSNASSELIYDYKNMYEEGYLRNWGLIISIIIVGLAVKNLYGNINGELNPSVQSIGNSVKNIGSNLYTNAKNIGGNVYNKASNYR
jgi:hypothetical protein